MKLFEACANAGEFEQALDTARLYFSTPLLDDAVKLANARAGVHDTTSLRLASAPQWEELALRVTSLITKAQVDDGEHHDVDPDESEDDDADDSEGDDANPEADDQLPSQHGTCRQREEETLDPIALGEPPSVRFKGA